jgi:uncharacterized membrane protein
MAMSGKERYPEIDVARGIAIVMMIIFHTLFDLNFFGIAAVNVATGFWRYFAYATASLFLLIVGISLTISRARAAPHLTNRGLTKKFLLRGAGIFCCGLLVTVATWWYLRDGFVIFGILHLIGVSVMIAPLFFRFRQWNAVIGLLVIAAGWNISTVSGPIWLLPLGLHPPAFWSVDYTPLLPWFGLVLIGLAAGELLYPGGERRFSMPSPLPPAAVSALTLLGRNSLVIYLVHQPVILAVLFLVTGAPIL